MGLLKELNNTTCTDLNYYGMGYYVNIIILPILAWFNIEWLNLIGVIFVSPADYGDFIVISEVFLIHSGYD